MPPQLGDPQILKTVVIGNVPGTVISEIVTYDNGNENTFNLQTDSFVSLDEQNKQLEAEIAKENKDHEAINDINMSILNITTAVKNNAQNIQKNG